MKSSFACNLTRKVSAAAIVLSLASGTANADVYDANAYVGSGRSLLGAVTLANHATFGPTEKLIDEIRAKGRVAWIEDQLKLESSKYTSGGTKDLHVNVVAGQYCDKYAKAWPTCWRDMQTNQPLVWDFYRNATTQPDQLRQRIAYTLSQILVISVREINATYGLKAYNNMLLDVSLTDWRTILRAAITSPVMGEYLNNVNNDKTAPNENFARELLQLFSLGVCELNNDGTLKGGNCQPTYDNAIVRRYARALTGWTYPAGGSNKNSTCWPKGANCKMLEGVMVPVQAFHDTTEATLLSNVLLPANTTPSQALEFVLDSIMNHPNLAPFVAKQFIQHLTTSNPSPRYIDRVANAFKSGKYQVSDSIRSTTFGSGKRGDMAAMVAAILLDREIWEKTDSSGKLREPALLMTGIIRALNGTTDGEPMGWWWGEYTNQHLFRSPSVFNFYQPDFPLQGTQLTAPTFGIHNASTALQRLNFITYLVDWNGSAPKSDIPGATGTYISYDRLLADAADAEKLVDRLSLLVLGDKLPKASRNAVLEAVTYWNQKKDVNWKMRRVQAAAFLIFSSPNYQIIR